MKGFTKILSVILSMLLIFMSLSNALVIAADSVPNAKFENFLIGFSNGLLYEGTVSPKVVSINKKIPNSIVMDSTNAEFLEVDFYADNSMKDFRIAMYDSNSKYNYFNVDVSSCVIGWNHIVIDLSTPAGNYGTFDKTDWVGISLRGDPNPSDDTELGVKVANVGITKSLPDLKTENFNVVTGLNGVGKTVTVPPSTEMYPSYQNHHSWSALDVTGADYIEFDILASQDTKSIIVWNATDVTAKRAAYTVPALEKGWNHVVIDLKNYRAANNGWTPETFTSWNGIFFQGTPSTTSSTTLTVANISATSKSPKVPKISCDEMILGDVHDCSGVLMQEKQDYSEAFKPILTGKFNAESIDFIEMLVHAPNNNNVTLCLNSTSQSQYNASGLDYTATASVELSSLSYGWNGVKIDLDGLLSKTKEWTIGTNFDSKNISYLYFTGISDYSSNSAFAVANIYFTTNTLTSNVHGGDHTLDGYVDMLDLVNLSKSVFTTDKVWFADYCEFSVAANDKLDASDIVALKKYLFENEWTEKLLGEKRVEDEFNEYEYKNTISTLAVGSEIAASAAIIVDTSNNTIVAQKNMNTVLYPASITKVMTILVAAEQIKDLNTTYTMTQAIKNACSGAAVAGISVGEELPAKDLLYAAFLPSGADAAFCIANLVAGSEANYAVLMNKKAAELGMKNTNFSNVTGLHSATNYSTAYDLAILMNAAMDNELCYKIMTTSYYTTTPTSYHSSGISVSNSFLSGLSGNTPSTVTIKGGKTGITGQAGYCLGAFSTSKTDSGKVYISVILKCSDRNTAFAEQKELYDNYIK